MKFAFCKVTKQWFTFGARGWQDAKGAIKSLSASPKKVTFYATEAQAKAAGYAPPVK